MAPSTSSILLTIYVCCETIRANAAYSAFHTYPTISASLIALLSEVLKLLIAIFFLSRDPTTSSFSSQKVEKYISILQNLDDIDWKRQIKYAIPAALYLTNNLIYYTVLPLTTPSLLQVCVLAKLPTTGILHHYMIKPQRNPFAWLSLLVLCIGLAIFNIPSSSSTLAAQSQGVLLAWYLAPIAGFVIACLSALASISSETSTKEGEFWESQALLYIWGIAFAALAYPLAPSRSAPPSTIGQEVASNSGLISAVLGVAVITAGTGLVVAIVLRARDNILKVIGTAASLITIAGSQYVLLPALRASTFTPWKICGGGMVVASTWCYNHYSQEAWIGRSWSFTQVPSEEEEEEGERLVGRGEKDEDEGLVQDAGLLAEGLKPNATKIVACAVVIAYATLEVALRAGS
ncbi:uncharacterized protein PAC_01431 [Phialocephala subalpina]|uniref:Uncharacterized protein n=1 Tax=Phialocephala subalpina TaxID=576137 RepID=A0A1L7WFK2_9HELO|nr:uncharacterized protein PAC_01431 [Phialocephala subalpina]